MRLTGGRLAGRVIQIPKGPRIRPTQDQIRQALFNLLGESVEGARVLDLFAGSGALGIEALSRGAAQVTFVDESRFCARAIEANLRSLGLPAGRGSYREGAGPVPCSDSPRPLTEQTKYRGGVCGTARGIRPGPLPTPAARVIQSEVGKAIQKLARGIDSFDLVFLDPPYGLGLATKALIELARCAIVSPAGSVVAEADKRDPLPPEVGTETTRLVLQRIERYGDTALAFYQRQ